MTRSWLFLLFHKFIKPLHKLRKFLQTLFYSLICVHAFINTLHSGCGKVLFIELLCMIFTRHPRTTKFTKLCINSTRYSLLAHLSRRLRLVGELIVYPWSGVRQSSLSTISNMNISATSGPIAIKFYLKHHWVRGKAALGFGPDRIRTLVSIATESSHRVIMEKTVSPLFLGCFSSDPFHTCRQ